MYFQVKNIFKNNLYYAFNHKINSKKTVHMPRKNKAFVWNCT